MAKRKKQPKKQNSQGKASKPKQNGGHYCWACGRHKSNESFSGKGHANHICKKCKAMPVAERNEMVAVRKIENMAHRYLNEQEIKWLRKKMKDPSPEVREAACLTHGMKFPRHERNFIKKGLTVFSLEMFFNGEAWNEWGDEIKAHMLVTMERDGTICRIDYNATEAARETKITIDEKEARAFLKSIIHEHDALFWNEDYGDSVGGDFDPCLNVLPDDGFDLDGDEDFEDEDGDENANPKDAKFMNAESDNAAESKEPMFSLTLELNKGGDKKIVFYNQLPDVAQDLFWSLMEWFELDGNFDYEEDEE